MLPLAKPEIYTVLHFENNEHMIYVEVVSERKLWKKESVTKVHSPALSS